MTGDPIRTTLGALVECAPALGRLGELPLPVRIAYHVSKLSRLVAHELKWFQTQRDAAIKERGLERAATADEVAAGTIGPVWQVDPKHRADFLARMQELQDLPVELAWMPLALEALDGHQISASDLGALCAAHLLEDP